MPLQVSDLNLSLIETQSSEKMNALEVFLYCLVAAVSAAPHVAISPASTVLTGHSLGLSAHSVGVPVAHSVGVPVAHSVGVPVAHSVGVPVAHSVGIAHQAVGVAPVAQTVGIASPALISQRTDIAHVPTTAVVDAPTVVQGAAISKTIHYQNQPVVTGYTSSIIKPNLGAVATPLHAVTQQRVAAVGRPVQTIVPHVTQVQPEVHVQRVAVDVPVKTPVVSEVEVRTPVVQGAPVVATPVVEARTVGIAPVATHAVGIAASPAVVDARAVGIAGGVVSHGVIGHGLVGHQGVIGQDVIAHQGLIAQPGVIAQHGIIGQHGIVGHHGVIAKNVW